MSVDGIKPTTSKIEELKSFPYHKDAKGSPLLYFFFVGIIRR